MDKMDYSSFYITQALFKLMEKEDYSSINISDISKKAGVGRATFYRHFKTKEDIIISFFKDKTKEFVKGLIYKPRSDEDYQDMITKAFETLYENKEVFQLLIKSHLEYIYLDYLNEVSFNEPVRHFENTTSNYFFRGALYNVSINWVKDDCRIPINTIVDEYMKIIFRSKQV